MNKLIFTKINFDFDEINKYFLTIIIFILSVTYGLFTLITWSMGLILVPGLTTIYLLIIILGSGNLLVLSVIGEYIGRIHIESKNRPLYTIRETVNFDE